MCCLPHHKAQVGPPAFRLVSRLLTIAAGLIPRLSLTSSPLSVFHHILHLGRFIPESPCRLMFVRLSVLVCIMKEIHTDVCTEKYLLPFSNRIQFNFSGSVSHLSLNKERSGASDPVFCFRVFKLFAGREIN